jgi:glycosyltransferase involved in cell wall biosynthesis
MISSINMPLVSIGIPAYNRPDRLRLTLQCIKDQTYSKLEIIISDDCSPSEGVDRVVKDAIKSGQQILFFRQPQNIGATKNFEFVFTKASGKYFLWAEDEDLFEPKFIEKLVECMEAQPELVACASDVKTIDNQDNFVALHQLDSIRLSTDWDKARQLFFRYPTSNVFFCILGMFRTDILRKANIRHLVGWKGYETNGEVPFLAEIATFGRIAAIPEALKTYRLNPNSIYHSEVRSFSYLDWIMLRLVIRYRLYKIAFMCELPIPVKLSLFKVIFTSYMDSVLERAIGNLKAILGRIKKFVQGQYGAL